jgi:hypothetical protein
MSEIKSENLKELKKIIDFYSNVSNLNESHNSSLLNFLMDTISDSLWQWKLNSGIIKFSKNLEKNVGEIVDLDSFLNLIHPDDIENMKTQMIKFIVNNSGKNIFTNQNLYESHYKIKKNDGTWVDVMDKAKIISWNDDGSPAVIVGINMNV